MNPYPFQVPIIGQNEYYYILKELNELKKKVAYLEEEINKIYSIIKILICIF